MCSSSHHSGSRIVRNKPLRSGHLTDSNRFCFVRFLIALHGKADTPWTRSAPTSLALYVFAMIYELVLTWDALRLKNTIQIIGLCLCNFGLIIYGSVQPIQLQDASFKIGLSEADRTGLWSDLRPALIAIPIVLFVGTLFMSFVARKLYNEFAWTIYKHISADLRMKRRYLTYQVSCSVPWKDWLIRSRSTLLFSNSTFSSSLVSRCNSWLWLLNAMIQSSGLRLPLFQSPLSSYSWLGSGLARKIWLEWP